MSEILVLNSGFIPLYTETLQESIKLLYKGKAYSVVETEKVLHSPSIAIKVPTVIALKEYGEYRKKVVKFSRLNVIYRDDMVCQYCGKRFKMNDLTVDHIIPDCRWSILKPKNQDRCGNWLNCVCACNSCNNKKGHRLLKELGWSLLNNPYIPEYLPHLIISLKKAEQKGWTPFCGINVKLIDMLP